MATKNYPYPGCGKRMKLTHGLTKNVNTCPSQQDLRIYMNEQDIPILEEDDNASGNFGPHEDEESTLEEQDIENDHKNLVGESSDTGNRANEGLLGRTP